MHNEQRVYVRRFYLYPCEIGEMSSISLMRAQASASGITIAYLYSFSFTS